MFYYKRLLSSLFALSIIVTLSACSTTATHQPTKKASKVPTQKVTATPIKKVTTKKVTTKAEKVKAQNDVLIQVNQQLDELFTPAIGLF